MVDEKIAKKYEEVSKKHGLPELKKLESDFGITNLESEKYPLVEIRKKIEEKIELLTSMLGNFFEGEASISNIYELRVIDEKDKEDLFKIYRKLMTYTRQANILSLSYDEQDEASFIKSFNKDFENLKPRIKKHFEKLKKSWEKDNDSVKEILNYLG